MLAVILGAFSIMLIFIQSSIKCNTVGMFLMKYDYGSDFFGAHKYSERYFITRQIA